MASIVVIEDNDSLRASIVSALSRYGHNATGVDSVEAFIESPPVQDPDILVIDLNLPGEDGLSFAARIRALDPHIGIVILTGRTKAPDKVAGYRSGADIYLTKPVSPAELDAAVNTLSRRLFPAVRAAPHGSILLYRRGLSGPDTDIALSAAEAMLLTALLRAPDRKLETWQIGEVLGLGREIPGRNAISAAIFRINRKIGQCGGAPQAIRAIRNWGYQLSAVNLVRAD